MKDENQTTMDDRLNAWMDWVDRRLLFWNRALAGREGWIIFASFFMVTYMSLLCYSEWIDLLPITSVAWLLITVFLTTVAVMLLWGGASDPRRVSDVPKTRESGNGRAVKQGFSSPSYSALAFLALGVLTVTLLITGIFISHTKLFYAFFCGMIGLFSLHMARRGDRALLARGMAKGILLGGIFICLLSLLLEPMTDTTYYGLFTNPNNLEPLCSLLLVSGLHLFLNESKAKWRVMAILGIALGAIVGVASRSRTFQLVAIVLAFAYLWLILRRFRGKKRLLSLLPLVTVVLSIPIFIYAVRPLFYQVSLHIPFLIKPYQEAKVALVRKSEIKEHRENTRTQAITYKPLGLTEWVSGDEVLSKLFTRVSGTMEAFDDVIESEIKMPDLQEEMEEIENHPERFVDEFYDQIPSSQQNTALSRQMNKNSLFFALDGIMTHRLNIWVTFLENTRLLGQKVPSFIVFNYGISGYPHNLLLQIGVDSGIFGGVAFLILFIRAGLLILSYLFGKSHREGETRPSLFFFPFVILVTMVSGMLSNGNVPFSNFIFFAYVSGWCIYSKPVAWNEEGLRNEGARKKEMLR